MASVKSLGLHHPAGLSYAIDEQILPPNPSTELYSWRTEPSTRQDHSDNVEDELFVTRTHVIWSRGGIIQKTYSFELEKESIVHALLAHFPSSQDRRSHGVSVQDGSVAPQPLEKGVVVFLKTQAHIYFLNGTEHIVHMPFEVESACAGPIGVIVQRKPSADDVAPLSLKIPRVPPNSFVSSQLNDFNASQQSTFSTENLGKPKPLHLELGSTMGDAWSTPFGAAESRWPRLISLTDPLLDLGLVVTRPDKSNNHRGGKPNSSQHIFLDPSEELLHLEQVKLPEVFAKESYSPLTLAVTANRDKATYSFWQASYLNRNDPFIVDKKSVRAKANRRRSSMQPGFVSGATTPTQQSLRESMGASLPGKKTRKSEKIEGPVDLVSSLEQHDQQGSGAARRSSRRVSSMMARADLSTSHERSVPTEQVNAGALAAGRRHDSYGSSYGRVSGTSGYGQHIRPSLGSLLEAPLDTGLDEDLLHMALDDHSIEGLQNEVLFTRIHTTQMDNSNVRYSVATKTALSQCKVFVLGAPPFATDGHRRSQLLVGVQDTFEKRLQIVMMHLKPQGVTEGLSRKEDGHLKQINISAGDVRRAQNVVDSCKITDGGESALLVLSEAVDGRHELSVQAPWSELTKLSLPLLFFDHTRSLQFRGRVLDRDVGHRKSQVVDLANGNITGLAHPRPRGVVSIVDTLDRMHQLQVQLQPRSKLVLSILNMIRSVLSDSSGERVYVGWLHVMQWLSTQQFSAFTNHLEWSSVSILLLCLFMNLGPVEGTKSPSARLPIRKRRQASGSFGVIRESEEWRSLEGGENATALGYPSWMLNEGWRWALDERFTEDSAASGDPPSFLTRHIALAKDFTKSAMGQAALGLTGYLPTALAKDHDSRRKVAVDIFMALHLLLEDQKLSILHADHQYPNRTDFYVIMCQISRWLKWHTFQDIYELEIQEPSDPRHDAHASIKPDLAEPASRPDIYEWIQRRLLGDRSASFLTPADIYYADSDATPETRHDDHRWEAIIPRTLMFIRFFDSLDADAGANQMVEYMRECGFSRNILETLPEAILVPLQDAIALSQPSPPSSWSKGLLDFVKRGDISLLLEPSKQQRLTTSNILTPTHAASWDFRLICQSLEETNSSGYDDAEGTERQAVIRALFKDDRRLNEAQDLLQTHKPRTVCLAAETHWSESEYLENQKELVSRIATGTLAIPAGRGLLYFSLRYPLLTQKFHIGGFNLNCVVKPANVTVGVDKSLFTEEKVCWSFFHQGAAAGLAISPQAKGIDTSWILYNKPLQELSNRHAGFLLALGLHGHLKGVAKWVAFKYLTPKHTMTSIGLLLGLAASYMGTMDSLITRLLSVHATRMLPRGAAELNISPLTQTSGIMGIGLLYCNSQHRRMSEIMLSEIEHIEQEDEEEPLRGECYRLAAGFALGLINLGKGNDLRGLHDMGLTEKLIAHATAAKDVDYVHVLDRSAAGAVMAIALIFMKSEDHIVARKIDVPDSVLQFDYVRPDILLLRTIAKNLILWSKIEPTTSWIQRSLPAFYRANHNLSTIHRLKSVDLPFFSILTGLCFSVALRFTGSASTKARDLLLHYLDHFIRITRVPSPPNADPEAGPSYDEELARSSARVCQDIMALSVSMVMAGTGDISVLRRLRSLHGRDDPDTPYGSHMAAHLAIGSLFLGCGTATFGSSNMAIAALLIAFYPIFPTDVMDNRSHLQAFRHFWVLATEQRCLVAKDVLTGQPIPVAVQIRMLQTSASDRVIHRTTPCLLPPLHQIAGLSTSCGPEYWDVDLDFAEDRLREAFGKTRTLFLRKRSPREDALISTLNALGRSKKESPLAWIFQCNALKNVSYVEKAALLDHGEDGEDVGAAVDAKLEMERGIVDGGDRERLEGARMLFEWGAGRSRLLSSGKMHSSDSQSTVKAAEQSRTDSEMDGLGEGANDANGNVWWMRDAAIDELKEKLWLAARDLEQ